MTDVRPRRDAPVTVFAALGLATLTGCLAATPEEIDIGGRTLSAVVLPMEDQPFGGMETYIDENGEEQTLFWDAMRTIWPVEVTAGDGRSLGAEGDEALAREAAEQACRAQGVPGLTEDATVLRREDLEGAIYAIRFEGCMLPEGGA